MAACIFFSAALTAQNSPELHIVLYILVCNDLWYVLYLGEKLIQTLLNNEYIREFLKFIQIISFSDFFQEQGQGDNELNNNP